MFYDTQSREEHAMQVVSGTEARELDHRSNDGVEVTLFWSQQTNRVWVSVADDARGDSFELDVDPSDALDAFHHPFAYADRNYDEFALAA
jgi:hypothetical protein